MEEEFADTEVEIRTRISKKIIQHDGQENKKENQRSTKHTYKTKDGVIRTPFKSGGELRCSGRVGSSYLFFDSLNGQNVIDNFLYHLHSNNESNLYFSNYLIQINDVDKQDTLNIMIYKSIIMYIDI